MRLEWGFVVVGRKMFAHTKTRRCPTQRQSRPVKPNSARIDSGTGPTRGIFVASCENKIAPCSCCAKPCNSVITVCSVPSMDAGLIGIVSPELQGSDLSQASLELSDSGSRIDQIYTL